VNTKEYCEMVENNSVWHKEQFHKKLIRENNSPLISLKESGFNLIFEPSVKKDYKYLVRQEIVEKIGRISKKLEKENKTLIIRSVWRSFVHQQLLWETKFKIIQAEFPDKTAEEIEGIVSNFIAKANKSMHSTGGAVDALIYDQKTESVLDFGTNQGVTINLNAKCYPYHPEISAVAKKNRKLLIGLFEKEDFVCDLKEYWHFDYGNVSWAITKGMKTAIYDSIPA
jgi:D-alanyl-D-alanine dipeptidase